MMRSDKFHAEFVIKKLCIIRYIGTLSITKDENKKPTTPKKDLSLPLVKHNRLVTRQSVFLKSCRGAEKYIIKHFFISTLTVIHNQIPA